MSAWSETEYGMICDRRFKGLGKALLAAAWQPGRALADQAGAACILKEPHAHLLVKRIVTRTDWSDPISGETAPVEPTTGTQET